MKHKPSNFILDVDGVMTTGQFLYSIDGKRYKIFGPHDNDGLKLIKNKINISFVTADRNGFLISKSRIVKDLGFKLKLVAENERYEYLNLKFGMKNIIYMGDSLYDAKIIKDSAFGIAPKNARSEAKNEADYITKNNSGEGAVLDACLKIKKKFNL